jgi:hypothetical protein
MKALLSVALFAVLSYAGANLAPADPLLHNGNLQDGLSGWEGDGRLVYLNPDGTEADDANTGAIPVIKLRLSNDSETAYQDYETHGSPTIAVPTCDFWIRGGPGWYYKLANALKPGTWSTVSGHFENLIPTDNHTVLFCAPPGDGSLYIKNAVVTQ